MPNQYTGPRPLLERFEEKINKTDGCWEWTACLNNKGYGLFNLGKGKYVASHRQAYRLYVGHLADDVDLMHICDNPKCVNPEHLVPCNHQQNMTDMVIKGRVKRKLTEDQVRAIRADTREIKYIAADYDITFQNVSKIKLGKTWRHI